MTALGKDARHQFPNTEAGQADVLAYANGRIAYMRRRLSRAVATLVPVNIMVKPVPVAIENGAPDGYAGAGTIDGSFSTSTCATPRSGPSTPYRR